MCLCVCQCHLIWLFDLGLFSAHSIRLFTFYHSISGWNCIRVIDKQSTKPRTCSFLSLMYKHDCFWCAAVLLFLAMLSSILSFSIIKSLLLAHSFCLCLCLGLFVSYALHLIRIFNDWSIGWLVCLISHLSFSEWLLSSSTTDISNCSYASCCWDPFICMLITILFGQQAKCT